MKTPNYRTGVKLEYLVMAILKAHLPLNCNVYRTAGSHSEADIIVIQNRRAATIQCKSRKARK